MQNKVLSFVVVLALLAAAAAAYFGFSGQKNISADIAGLKDGVEKANQRINNRTSPVIYTGDAVGYVLELEDGSRFYISGDAAPSADMKLIIGDYYKPDIAILSMGGLLTMGPKEAAFATSLINPKKFVTGYHYASYPMLVQTADEFISEVKKYNLVAEPLALKIGEEKNIMGAKVTWLGHASLFIVSPGGKKFLIDPTNKLGMLPEQYKDFTGFGQIDFVLLTHGHPDHVAVSDLDRIQDLYQPLIITPYELGNWLVEHIKIPDLVFYLTGKGGVVSKEILAKLGIPEQKVGDIKINIVSANHSSAVAPQ